MGLSLSRYVVIIKLCFRQCGIYLVRLVYPWPGYMSSARENLIFAYVRSCQMAADIFTKPTPNPEGWVAARRKINVLSGVEQLSEVAFGTPVAANVAHACYGIAACVAISAQEAEVTPRPFGAVAGVTPRVPSSPAMEIQRSTPHTSAGKHLPSHYRLCAPEPHRPQGGRWPWL